MSRTQTVRKARVSAKKLRLRRVLLATDGSSASAHAVRWAADLARRNRSAITILTVVPPAANGSGRQRESTLTQGPRGRAAKALARVRRSLSARGVAAQTRVVTGSPASAIARAARKEHADLIVVGSHGRGAAGRAFLGSVADGVRHRARTSVLIAKSAPPARRILVADDGSRLGERAARMGWSLAQGAHADVRMLHVLAPPFVGLVQGARMMARELVKDGLGSHGPRRPVDVRSGVQADHIVRAAQESHSNLIVMGSRSMGWLDRWLAGSVSDAVSHKARASVLIVKGARP